MSAPSLMCPKAIDPPGEGCNEAHHISHQLFLRTRLLWKVENLQLDTIVFQDSLKEI
jgi:hypothetical protein